MDSVVAIGLLLGLFGGFLSTMQSIRSYYSVEIKNWFEFVEDCLGQLDTETDEQKKIHAQNLRSGMDWWVIVWRVSFIVPVLVFLVFNLAAAVYCFFWWESLTSPQNELRHFYNDFIGSYALIVFLALATAGYSLKALSTKRELIKNHTGSVLGSNFKKPSLTAPGR